jgi:hypothetical protein
MGEKRKRLWMHQINEKRGKKNALQNFLQEMRCDEKKFKNFTRLSLEIFYFIVNLNSDKIRKTPITEEASQQNDCYSKVGSMLLI